MGASYSAYQSHLSPGRDYKVLFLGLDNAGKSTALYRLKFGDEMVRYMRPTIGFDVFTIDYSNTTTITAWKVNGQEKTRALWQHYYSGTLGLVFVVDASDPERFETAAEALGNILQHPETPRNMKVLVLANKQDLDQALTCEKIIEKMDISALLKQHKWHMEPTVAPRGTGLSEGLDWMVEAIRKG